MEMTKSLDEIIIEDVASLILMYDSESIQTKKAEQVIQLIVEDHQYSKVIPEIKNTNVIVLRIQECTKEALKVIDSFVPVIKTLMQARIDHETTYYNKTPEQRSCFITQQFDHIAVVTNNDQIHKDIVDKVLNRTEARFKLNQLVHIMLLPEVKTLKLQVYPRHKTRFNIDKQWWQARAILNSQNTPQQFNEESEKQTRPNTAKNKQKKEKKKLKKNASNNINFSQILSGEQDCIIDQATMKQEMQDRWGRIQQSSLNSIYDASKYKNAKQKQDQVKFAEQEKKSGTQSTIMI